MKSRLSKKVKAGDIFPANVFVFLFADLGKSLRSYRKLLVVMPKRQNPFGDASPLQFKSHIGTKEVDMGVNREENMQRVYGMASFILCQFVSDIRRN